MTKMGKGFPGKSSEVSTQTKVSILGMNLFSFVQIWSNSTKDNLVKLVQEGPL